MKSLRILYRHAEIFRDPRTYDERECEDKNCVTIFLMSDRVQDIRDQVPGTKFFCRYHKSNFVKIFLTPILALETLSPYVNATHRRDSSIFLFIPPTNEMEHTMNWKNAKHFRYLSNKK